MSWRALGVRLIGVAALLVSAWFVPRVVLPVAVTGGSMQPTLSAGDLVLVLRTVAVQPGDIALFRKEGHLVLHRMLGLENGEFVTKGDANPVADVRRVPRASVIGRALWVIPSSRARSGLTQGR